MKTWINIGTLESLHTSQSSYLPGNTSMFMSGFRPGLTQTMMIENVFWTRDGGLHAQVLSCHVGEPGTRNFVKDPHNISLWFRIQNTTKWRMIYLFIFKPLNLMDAQILHWPHLMHRICNVYVVAPPILDIFAWFDFGCRSTISRRWASFVIGWLMWYI